VAELHLVAALDRTVVDHRCRGDRTVSDLHHREPQRSVVDVTHHIEITAAKLPASPVPLRRHIAGPGNPS
jgi:hypothetical protein